MMAGKDLRSSTLSPAPGGGCTNIANVDKIKQKILGNNWKADALFFCAISPEGKTKEVMSVVPGWFLLRSLQEEVSAGICKHRADDNSVAVLSMGNKAG